MSSRIILTDFENRKIEMKENTFNNNTLARYPLLHEAISVIILNVIDGIKAGSPIHMGLGYSFVILDASFVDEICHEKIKEHLRQYSIVESNSAVSGSYVRLKHQKGQDIFEPGEFIYLCRSGCFHLKFDAQGAIEEIISDFDGKTPVFVNNLIIDFPGKNFEPDDKLLKDIGKNGFINSTKFLNGLKPHSPILIEID